MRARTFELFLGTPKNLIGALSLRARQPFGIGLVICLGLSCGNGQEMRLLELGEWRLVLPAPVTCSWSLEANELRDLNQPAGIIMALCNASFFPEPSRGKFGSLHIYLVEVVTGSVNPGAFVGRACCQYDALRRPRRDFKRWRLSTDVEAVECQYGGPDVGPEAVKRVGLYLSNSSALMIELSFPSSSKVVSPIHELIIVEHRGARLKAG